MRFLEPGMCGIKLGDCGVHVFEVEPHLQCDSPFPIDAVDRKSKRLNSSHTEIYPLSLHDALPIFLEPGMCGIKLGDCGLHVFEVEPHLQCDSPFHIDAVQLEKFVLRRPRTHVESAQRHSSESHLLASHGDDDVVRPHPPCLEIAPRLMHHLIHTKLARPEADDLPPTL